MQVIKSLLTQTDMSAILLKITANIFMPSRYNENGVENMTFFSQIKFKGRYILVWFSQFWLCKMLYLDI